MSPGFYLRTCFCSLRKSGFVGRRQAGGASCHSRHFIHPHPHPHPLVGFPGHRENTWSSLQQARVCGVGVQVDVAEITHSRSTPASATTTILQVPLACCGGCFDALYLDAEQKPLEGELAGDVASTSPPRLASPGGDGNAATVERGDGGQVAGGPKGWKLVKCFHEP